MGSPRDHFIVRTPTEKASLSAESSGSPSGEQGADADAVLNSINTSHSTAHKGISVLRHLNEGRYKVKYRVAGDYVEIYEYDDVQVKPDGKRALTKFIRGPQGEEQEPKEDRSGRAREGNIRRAVKHIKHLVNANHKKLLHEDKFITLTYTDEMEDRKQALIDFDRFVKRLRRKHGYFKHITVLEIQHKREEKTGKRVIHLHMATFGLPYVPNAELGRIWSHGFVRINRQRAYENPGQYMAKCISKDFAGEENNGKKMCLVSKGLHHPEENKAWTAETVMKRYGDTDECLTYDHRYGALDIGWVTYRQYDLRKRGGIVQTGIDTRENEQCSDADQSE